MIESIVSAVGGGTVAILVKWAYAAWKRRADFKKLLGHIDIANESLRRIVNETGAKRAVIVAGHNGDGVPRLGKHVKTSILYEYRAPGEHEFKSSSQDVIISPEQTKHLIRAFTEYSTCVNVSDLGNGPMLDQFTTHGIAHADLYFLFQEKTRWYYLEVHFSDENEETAGHRDLIREEVNKLQCLFKGDA